MSADANLGPFVIEAPGFSKTSASELSGAPLASSEIESAAQSLAADLKAAGAASHEPVALFISNRPQDLVAFLGLWLARCIVAPIHVATPEQAAQGISPGWAPISSSAPGNSKRSVVPRRPRGRC